MEALRILFAISAIYSLLGAQALAHAGVTGENFEFSGYLRTGSGTNSKGGDQECFSNSGAPAWNEFRLGNECALYGETAFTAYHLRGEASDPYFKTQVRFAFFPPGHSAFEDNDTDERDINIFEAYVEAGNLEGRPFKYWVGKRIYRDTDLHMYDWYYYANMSGNGAGIYDIPLGPGTLALAHFLQVGTTRSEVGAHAVQVLDVQWRNVKFFDDHEFNFWLAGGKAPGGADTTDPDVIYEENDGWLAGTRFRSYFGSGFNDFSVIYGQSLMEGLSLYGNPALPQSDLYKQDASRWRAINHLTYTLSHRWAFHLGLAYETWDSGATEDSGGEWASIGLRPVYFFTDHFQLAFEGGISQVTIDSERDGQGRRIGPRYLSRLTIAPQIAINRNIWGRPVLRAFYTHSFWNKENRESIANGAPSFANASEGGTFGWHAEVWF